MVSHKLKMSEKELNIKSSTIDKGLELIKEFVSKLISPTLEQIGLLSSDQIKYFRFKNQVKILEKSRKYVEKRNINLKEIPIKILVPLLEQASLEEDESMQELWARLLTNMIDSDKNLQNNIFPYILGQISIEEFNELEKLNYYEIKITEDYNLMHKMRQNIIDYLHSEEYRILVRGVSEIEQNGFLLGIEGFEISNLIRLGLIERLPPKIEIEEFEIKPSPDGLFMGIGHQENNTQHSLSAKYDMYDNFGFRITDLGTKFIECCQLNNEVSG